MPQENKYIDLPKELDFFEELIRNYALNNSLDKEYFENNAQCLALVRCIPTAEKKIWDEISTQNEYKEWFTLEVDFANISPQSFLETIQEKTKEFQTQTNELDAEKIRQNQAKCLVQAHEKQFLFFGTL